MREIEGFANLNQVKALAEKARKETSDFMDGKNNVSSFANTLEDALSKVNELQNNAGALKTRYATGDESVSLSDAMIAAQRSSLAFEATLQVRNKLVQAYKDIMSMPI